MNGCTRAGMWGASSEGGGARMAILNIKRRDSRLTVSEWRHSLRSRCPMEVDPLKQAKRKDALSAGVAAVG